MLGVSPINSFFADSLEGIDANARYDQACKYVLSNKYILAWIMKYCVAEYRDCTIEDIVEKYIEGQPDVSDIPVRRDAASRIHGGNTEDGSINERTIRYDIKFDAIAPDASGDIRLIINIEAQNKYNNGYPLIKRGIFYGARLISAQDGVEFEGSDYGGIKKVYSIWICMNSPARLQNKITEYRISEYDIVGDAKDDVKNYDLLRVVMVYLGKSIDENEKLLRLLGVLFSEKLRTDDKKEILSDEYGISMRGSIREAVDYMCNLSEGLIERGIERGIELGREQGIELGREQGIELGREQGIEKERHKSVQMFANSIKLHMDSMKLSFDTVADMLALDSDYRRMCREFLGIE